MANEAPNLSLSRGLRARRRPVVTWAVLLVSVAAICYALPPVKFVRKISVGPASMRPTDIAASARRAWDERLQNSASHAANASELLTAIRTDRVAASRKYGRRVGVGGSYFYFVTGVGRVIRKTPSRIDLVIDPAAKEAEVCIETGNIFGNAIRDGTDVFKIGDFENSRDFNQLSQELNKLVETRILPVLREKAAVGSELRFTGVAEVTDEDQDLHPLHIVPLAAEVK